jgi:hypothetical protein
MIEIKSMGKMIRTHILYEAPAEVKAILKIQMW